MMMMMTMMTTTRRCVFEENMSLLNSIPVYIHSSHNGKPGAENNLKVQVICYK